jgi:hypothetical protein
LLGNDRETNNDKTAISMQQLCNYAILLEPLLGSGLRATVEVLLEEVFSTWSALRLYHSTDRVGARHQDWRTDWPSVAMWRWLWLELVSRPCGGGVEYFHRRPASRRRRQKRNPVDGGVTGPSFSGGYKYGDLALQVGGVPNLKQWNVVMSPAGLGPENHRDYECKCSVEKRILVVIVKGLVAKTNWLAVKRQSYSNSDSDSDSELVSAVQWSGVELVGEWVSEWVS